MDLEKALNKLYSLHTLGVKLGLTNIKNFLNLLGKPHLNLKAFHIAGSNGKGSTAAFIASILQEMRFKVGLYTSPHFVRFNERIKINGKEISNERIAQFIKDYERNLDLFKLTFFEATTGLAFQYFAEEKVDFAVIETGLGGRLDATNVLNPLSSVITSISLEHTEILGNTIEKIAEEKSGVIKPHTKVFIGKLVQKAEEVIERKCEELGNQLFKLEDYIIEKNAKVELYTEELKLDEWIMPLRGKYQKYNAALAALTVSKTLDYNNFRIIENGIKNVVKNTGLQGRFEFIHYKPDIILDSAHNPEGVVNFINEFKLSKKKYSKTTLLFGAMKDKNVKEMLSILSSCFDEIYLTSVQSERAYKTSELETIADQLQIMTNKIDNPSEFVIKFLKEDPTKCLVVLGSMYLLGEVKSQLEKLKVA